MNIVVYAHGNALWCTHINTVMYAGEHCTAKRGGSIMVLSALLDVVWVLKHLNGLGTETMEELHLVRIKRPVLCTRPNKSF